MNTWYAEGLRWIAGILLSAAERVEGPRPDDDDLFDSDAYLAEIRARVGARHH